jgi:hypothetical protein
MEIGRFTLKTWKILLVVCVMPWALSGCDGEGLLVMTPFDTFGAPVFYDDSTARDDAL